MKHGRAAAVIALALSPLSAPAPAGAVISPAQTIDGPSADILELGGVAMAQDGDGGLVYLKREGGRAHVFASRLSGGKWLAPQRVDAGQAFASSWPRIAAGNRGRLVVVWANENGLGSDRLWSATLGPGSTRFGAPIPVDLNVGEASATFPSVDMNAGGTAYVAYRVLPDSGSSAGVPPGYVRSDTRLARYGGEFWSVLGFTADRNSSAPVRIPNAQNSPQIGVDVQGNAVVAFQEPDDDFVDRVWARRIFGGNVGIPLIVSPTELGGKPLRGPADAFALDVAGFGEAAVALRQQPGQDGALAGPRLFVNTMPEAFSDAASKFAGARLADGAPEAGVPGPVRFPSVGVVPTGEFEVGFGLGATTLTVSGDDGAVHPPERLDDGTGAGDSDPVVDLAPSGAAVQAWRTAVRGRPAISAREQGADTVSDTRVLSATRGGPVSSLLLRGSGLGDAAVAWEQGNEGAGQIAAAAVDAPPADFSVQTPVGFTRARRVSVRWDAAPHAIGDVKYSVTVDDQVVVDDLKRLGATLGPNDLDDGLHAVQVIVTDSAEQETASVANTVRIDRRAPRVVVSRAKGSRKVTVRVIDGAKKTTSGVDARRTNVRVGGARPRRGARVSRRFAGPGTYTIVARVRDKVGNSATIRRRVRVP